MRAMPRQISISISMIKAVGFNLRRFAAGSL